MTKMVISSENARKITMKTGFPVLFAERMEILISSYASFEGVGCIRNTVVFKVN